MTPCEKLGWKEGDRFIVNNNYGEFSKGKAAKSAKKLERELERLKKQLPEGFKIVRTTQVTTEDMSDLRNWKDGDYVECLESYKDQFTKGKLYQIDGEVLKFSVPIRSDDKGQYNGWNSDRFRFHYRPVQS